MRIFQSLLYYDLFFIFINIYIRLSMQRFFISVNFFNHICNSNLYSIQLSCCNNCLSISFCSCMS